MPSIPGCTTPPLRNRCNAWSHRWRCRLLAGTLSTLVFIGLVLIATLVILKSRKSPQQQTEEVCELKQMAFLNRARFQSPPHKTYLISLGDDFGSLEARGERGELIGLNKKLVDLVCEEASIDCDIVYSPYELCWFTAENDLSSGAQGLLGRWWDGCLGWFVTLPRMAVYSFADSFLQREKAYFFHRIGTDFDPTYIVGKKIGFIRAWAMDLTCIRNKEYIAGGNIPEENVYIYDKTIDGIKAVESGEIDALFHAWGSAGEYTKTRDITYNANQPINCLLEGSSLMTRKDSDLPALWNIGFHKARFKGRFRRLCEQARKRYLHLGQFSCIDEDVI